MSKLIICVKWLIFKIYLIIFLLDLQKKLDGEGYDSSLLTMKKPKEKSSKINKEKLLNK